MDLLKKRGRPSKKEEAAKKAQEEAEELSAKLKELEGLRQQLKGKTIHYKREELHISFKIEKVMALYDGICLTDGTPDGYSITLRREELDSLMMHGVYAKETQYGPKTTCETFTLVEGDGQLATQKDVEEAPVTEAAQKPEPEGVLLNPDFDGQSREEGQKYEENAPEGSDIVADCIHDTSAAFLRMLERLENKGCAPQLVISAYRRKESLLETLYLMVHWYEKEEDAE